MFWPGGKELCMIWPDGHGMIYGMALWQWHGICYGLACITWYMVWPGEHLMVYGMPGEVCLIVLKALTWAIVPFTCGLANVSLRSCSHVPGCFML